MQKEDCYFLGIISKRHGYKGSVILKLDTDTPETYRNLESVFLEKEGILIPFFIKKANLTPTGTIIIDFEDLSQDQVDAILGKGAYLPLSTLPPLTGNKFYYHEVIGFDFIDEVYGKVGKIKSINDHSAQPLFEVDAKGKEVIVPIINHWVLEVNRADKFVKVTTPEGLIEMFLG